MQRLCCRNAFHEAAFQANTQPCHALEHWKGLSTCIAYIASLGHMLLHIRTRNIVEGVRDCLMLIMTSWMKAQKPSVQSTDGQCWTVKCFWVGSTMNKSYGQRGSELLAADKLNSVLGRMSDLKHTKTFHDHCIFAAYLNKIIRRLC